MSLFSQTSSSIGLMYTHRKTPNDCDDINTGNDMLSTNPTPTETKKKNECFSRNTITSDDVTNEAIDRIIVMRRQETTVYQCADYLFSEPQTNQNDEYKQDEDQNNILSPQNMWQALEECIRFIDSLSLGPQENITCDEDSCLSAENKLSTRSAKRKNSFSTVSTVAIEDISTVATEYGTTREQLSYWRGQMCSWSYAVVDSFGLDRETVAVAFSMLDRYIALDDEPEAITREEFQLISMTALYTAAKIADAEGSLSTYSLIEMSRGHVCSEDVTAMEMKMLDALEWRLNPPTAMAFAHEFLNLLPVSDDQRMNMLAVSNYISELAVADSFFVSFSPSSIAVATVLVAASYDFSAKDRSTATSFAANALERHLLIHANINVHSEEITTIFDRLNDVYQKQHAQ
uniref:Cyclin N-terminal domain-containing protein n=1 Tax=Ditylum brightwellii TaxID=49249 RepID=A0A7S2ECQ2_9STRA|mmetsp:Transcript_2394/g.3744  ORF Transcript_2394/g.3744 Transcript_2394/m.3744 type:complete len:403 (+) Transcript_2394:47-1255(+)